MAAPTPVLTTLLDTRDEIIIRVFVPGAGDTDITATTLCDISTFTTGRTVTQSCITRILGSTDGFTFNVLEDATTDVAFCCGGEGMFDLRFPDQLLKTLSPSGGVGDYVFTTTGLTAANDGAGGGGCMLVFFRKMPYL